MKLSSGRTLDDFKNVFRVSTALLVIVFLVLTFRVWHLQILNGQKWYTFSESNRIKLKTIPAIRGKMYDRNHIVLAESHATYDLIMVPNRVSPSVDQALAFICDLIQWDYEEAKKNFIRSKHPNPNRSFVIKKNLNRNEVAMIKANQPRLDGFDVQVVPTRRYNFPQTANHIIGKLGEIDAKAFSKLSQQETNRYKMGNFWGVSGLEQMYESDLRGIDGVKPVLEDVWGREQELEVGSDLLPNFSQRKAVPGDDLYLTLDMELQLLATDLLEGKKASIVAMDPRSGEVLLMESQPSFIAQEFVRGVPSDYWRSLVQDPDKPLLDRTIQGIYPPASTFKVITAFAALIEKVSDVEEYIYCPGHYRLGRETKRCWKREGHGYMNVVDALKYSCDVYFYEVSKRLGIEAIAKYARQFGLGSPTTQYFKNEASGLVPDSQWKQRVYKQPWVGGETLSVGIGQGAVSTTPLQMAVAYSALVNGGDVLEPQVVLGVQSLTNGLRDGFERKEKGKIAYPKEVIEPILKGLEGVVQERGATAYYFANSPLVSIAGKTGTAQVVALKFEDVIRDHAWFVGYAPADDPEIVVSLIVEHGKSGSSGAAPIVRKIIEKYFEKEEL